MAPARPAHHGKSCFADFVDSVWFCFFRGFEFGRVNFRWSLLGSHQCHQENAERAKESTEHNALNGWSTNLTSYVAAENRKYYCDDDPDNEWDNQSRWQRASDHRRPHRKSEEHCQNAKDPRFIVIEDGVEGTTRGHMINSLRLIGSWWCFFVLCWLSLRTSSNVRDEVLLALRAHNFLSVPVVVTRKLLSA